MVNNGFNSKFYLSLLLLYFILVKEIATCDFFAVSAKKVIHMERMNERKIFLEIKGHLFDLICSERHAFSFSNLITQMLATLKVFLNAKEVDYYSLVDWKQQLTIIASTRNREATDAVATGCQFVEDHAGEHSFLKKPHSIPGFEQYDFLVMIKKQGKLRGFIAIEMNEGAFGSALTDSLLEMISLECASFIDKIWSYEHTLIEEKKYRQLFRVTEKFHSTMDMDAVLEEIISTLRDVYPSFTYYLMLSHDHKGYGSLPVKDLEYDGENITAMQSYVSGQVQFEDSLAERNSIMYAPLKGKQGVYGVLQVIATDALVFPQTEVEFIKLLANTAGSALENAKLYDQSRRLIADLRLINETSHQLNSNLRLSDTMNFICGQIVKSFEAQEVGFIVFGAENDSLTVLKGSTDFFFEKEAESYILDFGNRIKQDQEPLFIGDFESEAGGPSVHYRSVMGVPMIQSGTLKGFALVLHEAPYQFAFDTFKLLQSLIHHSTLAFTNSILREELEKMVITDHLTKLYARGYLDEKMNLSMLEDAQGAFILIDIDNFKGVNDKYGHQAGDEVLVQLARHISKNIRGTDIGARWGGEELAIYLPGAPLEIGVLIANRLVEHVEKQTTPRVTISCGVSSWIKGQEDTAKTLFKRADQALYVAKSSGKNKVVVQKENKFSFSSTQE